MLESYIKQKLKEKELLLMTHIVLGYPSFDESMAIVDEMVDAGVDLMELQIPFSEPMADGPVILKANQVSLERGAKVRRCFEFAKEAAERFDIPFLFMTYYNILFKYGIHPFAGDMAGIGLTGAIVPDLPPEESSDYLDAMAKNAMSPIYIFSPTTSDDRMKTIASYAGGFIYCTARKGVTGKETRFEKSLEIYLARCRAATDLPLALGFGVKDRADVDFLRGKTDIAVIGSQTIRVVEEEGPKGAGRFIRELLG